MMTAIPSGAALFAPVLERLERDASEYFRASSLRLVPAGWQDRPASYLLRVGVCPAADDEPISHLFVKIFKPRPIEGGHEAMQQRVARDFATTLQVYRTMCEHRELGVVPPVACYPEYLAIVTEQVEGDTLMDHLRREAAWFPGAGRLERLTRIMAKVGRWIRTFQSSDVADGLIGVEELREYVDIRLRRLAGHARSGFGESDRQLVLRHIERIGGEIHPEELTRVAIHADMALGNILVAGDRVVVLDFAMAQRGSRLHDLTRLCLQIELLGVKPAFRMSIARRLQLALMRGFADDLNADTPLFRLLLLLHRVNHLTSLTVAEGQFADNMYNRVVRRHHRSRLATELARTVSPSR